MSRPTSQDINRVRLLAHRACHPGGQHSLCPKAELHLAIDTLAEMAGGGKSPQVADVTLDPNMPEVLIEVRGANGSVAWIKIRIAKERK